MPEKKCSDCGKEAEPQLKICEVCRLLDKDNSEKLCGWCQMCDAWICIADQTDFIRRGRAFFKSFQ